MNNIYLIGMPGCGKTTIGMEVAAKLGVELIDLDRAIVEREGRTIPEIFEDGEAVFRKAETEALKEIASKENLFVATGGGIVTQEENIGIMKCSGKVIFIDASVEFIQDKSALEGRPLLKDKKKIYELYNSRIALYRKAADLTVENNGILSDVCRKAEEAVRKLTKNCEKMK